MRWMKKKKKVVKLEKGAERTRSTFLFLPKCLKEECRWFESSKIIQKVKEVTASCDGGGSIYLQWEDDRWGN